MNGSGPVVILSGDAPLLTAATVGVTTFNLSFGTDPLTGLAYTTNDIPYNGTAADAAAIAAELQLLPSISNFGDVCLHNLRYWRRETYLGFGLAAHSFAGERRFANTRDIARYVAGAGEPDLDESLGPAEQRRETIFLRLRQSAGIDYDDIVSMCGEEGIEWIARGLDDGWLRRDGARVAFTPAGFLLSNDYISQLF